MPPIPDFPEFQILKWEDNFRSEVFTVSEFPFLYDCILKSGINSIQYWIILSEDVYESKCGDGKFIYFNGCVYKNELDAKINVDILNKKNKWVHYTSKPITIIFENNSLKTINSMPKLYEHYDIKKIIRRIDEILSSNGTMNFGKEESSRLFT